MTAINSTVIQNELSLFLSLESRLVSSHSSMATSVRITPPVNVGRPVIEKTDSVSVGTLRFSVHLDNGNRRSRFYSRQNGQTATTICNSIGNASSVIGENTTSMLDEVNVFDLDGRAIIISDLWKERKAVVAFARHFGCVLCRKRANYLASVKDKMDAAGVALVLIGPGKVDQAKAFSEQTKFKGEVYADPSYSSYKALNFVSGVTTTFTPKAGLKIIQLYMEGYRQDWGLSFEKDTRTKGGWQQGGIIVAGPGKSNISYVHKDKEAGDDPELNDILEACCL